MLTQLPLILSFYITHSTFVITKNLTQTSYLATYLQETWQLIFTQVLVCVKVAQSCLTLQFHGLYCPWNSPGQNTGVSSQFPSPGDLPNPGTKPRSPAVQADSLPAEPPGKPSHRLRNTKLDNLIKVSFSTSIH